MVFYIGFKTEEDWIQICGINFSDKTQVLTWFRQAFADWDSNWLNLFEKAEYPLVLRPQYCMPLDQTWEALPNLTMLGDAAHLMPPYAGEGVNMAMLDALELSNCLTSNKFSTIQTAIAAYENQMRSRASEVAQLTLDQTEALHSPAAMTHMLALFNEPIV